MIGMPSAIMRRTTPAARSSFSSMEEDVLSRTVVRQPNVPRVVPENSPILALRRPEVREVVNLIGHTTTLPPREHFCALAQPMCPLPQPGQLFDAGVTRAQFRLD